MKNKNLPLILMVVVLVIGLMAAIYISDSFPAYNGMIDTAFSDIAGLFKGKKTEATGQNETGADGTVTVSKKEAKKEAKKALQSDIYELTDGSYTLASAGKHRWIFESEWPFITEPVLLNDAVISVTAEPAFIMLSYEKGELLAKAECPVYPGETMKVQGMKLVLTGRNGQSYDFYVEGDNTFTYMGLTEGTQNVSAFLTHLEPDAKAIDFIRNRIREWTSDDARQLPDMKVYTGHINREGNGNFFAQKNEDADTMFYIFTPDKQGLYQIGLADENGVWIQANAFVAVFGENGDMKQVSIDYVANKPQVKLHLSESEIYYIVAGWAKDMYSGTETWLQIAESH